ncbi:hypothetical protein VHEMI05508 [[Torrubiella] hemipterigena]|uniref:Major facilitator superfamily transporter n=1 Tax=[Torrubiella] hemipterigena TaxID=1531966 RepID=A0A0A1THA8_9HYPO|nr:hypothetical protein VHEMI05508 [[Torrubiella] hemipterigena]
MADETTPLLRTKSRSRSGGRRVCFDIETRILVVGFLITLSFACTQVALIYVFRVMTCDAFYDDHPPYTGDGDRCYVNEITAESVTQYSILGMTTTLCGIINLFVSGWMVKKFGARKALLIQTVVPTLRTGMQVYGIWVGKRLGMLIVQSTQIVTIIGGPVGYILVMNIIAGEIVQPERRTAVFGKLQGALMLGNGLGLFTGGQVGELVGIIAPFGLAFICFNLSSLVARLTLPYIPPPPPSKLKKGSKSSKLPPFLEPLRVLSPQTIRLANGTVRKHYGVLYLCTGIFTGVLATDYVALLVQLYATSIFQFDQADNGWLMSEFASVRGLFLIFIFPRIIGAGRDYFARRKNLTPKADEEESASETTPLYTNPSAIAAPTASQLVQEPVISKSPIKDYTTGRFDLVFLRYSLVVESLMTSIAAFATKPWHIYLVAFLLPFGSGSAPAAKGVITDMCPESQRADALNAVTLVENVARLMTQGLFGFIFSSLASVGKAYLTFFCNASIALIGMLILLFSHFPPPGSVLVEQDEQDEQNEEAE